MICVVVHMQVMHCFPLATFKIFSLYFGFSSLIIICLHMDFFGFNLFLDSLNFLNLSVHAFAKTSDVFSHYFFLLFPHFFQHCIFTYPLQTQMLLSSHRFLRLCLFLKLLLYGTDWIILDDLPLSLPTPFHHLHREPIQ